MSVGTTTIIIIQLEESHKNQNGTWQVFLNLIYGNISFPLIGDVRVQGRTVEEVRQEIEEKIRGYIPDAPVAVMDISSRRFTTKVAVLIAAALQRTPFRAHHIQFDRKDYNR